MCRHSARQAAGSWTRWLDGLSWTNLVCNFVPVRRCITKKHPLPIMNAVSNLIHSRRLPSFAFRSLQCETSRWKLLNPPSSASLRGALLCPFHHRVRPFTTKSLASSRVSKVDEKPTDLEPQHPRWVVLMNDALKRYPLECGMGYIFLDATTILTLYSILTFGFNVVVPVDFALAYGLNRLLRRFRLPLDALVAALLVRAFPHLRLVNVTHSFHAIAAAFSFQSHASTTKSSGATGSGAASTVTSANPPPLAAEAPSPFSSILKGPFEAIKKLGSLAAHVLDSYGLALLIAQRCIVSLGSTCLLYALLSYGVDVEAHLEVLGISAEIGGAASKWAAAACLAAPLFPAVLLGSARLAPLLAKARLAMSPAFLRKAAS
jgi:hypothetical protein